MMDLHRYRVLAALALGMALASTSAAQVDDPPAEQPPVLERADGVNDEAAAEQATADEPAAETPRRRIDRPGVAVERPDVAVDRPQVRTVAGQPAAPARVGTQLADEAAIATTATHPVLLNFQNAPLDAVLEYLSETAGLIVIKSIDVQGTVTVISRQPMTVEEAISTLNSVLKEKGYAAILMDRTLKIVDFNVASLESIPVRVGGDPMAIPRTDEMVVQVIPLRNADCTQLANDIADLLPPYAKLSANVRTNSLILTDTSANIHRITQIVQALDESLANEVVVRVFVLEFADANDAATLVNDLFGSSGNGRGGRGGRGGGRDERMQMFLRMSGRGGVEAGAETPGGGRPDVAPHAAADERTNTVVVTGSPASLDIIADVLEELDSNPQATEAVLVHKVRNGTADQLADVLNQLFQSTGGRSGRSRATGSTRGGRNTGGFGNRSNSNSPFGGGTNRTNSSNRSNRSRGRSSDATRPGTELFPNNATVLVAQELEPEEYQGLPNFQDFPDDEFVDPETGEPVPENALVGEIDVVAEADTNSLIIRSHPRNFAEIQSIIEELDRPIPQVLIKVLVAEVTHDQTNEHGAEWSILNDAGTANLFTNFGLLGPGAGGLIFTLAENNLEVTLRALEARGKLDVLSRPYILVAENQEASITVGQEVPFIRTSRVTDAGQVINDIQYEDIGIILSVIPHINSEGLVVMDVAPEISAITDSTVQISETVSAPIFSKRSAITRVAVQDGHTIVIGGLMQDQLSETVRKVPLIGDVPLLGELFKSTRRVKTKTELLIFLTPHVARDAAELQRISIAEESSTKIVPKAVAPGMYKEHMEGLRRGQRPERSTDPLPPPVTP